MINPTAGTYVGTGLMGASAKGNAYQEMLNLGYDKGQAQTYSTLVGLSEAGLQKAMGGIGKFGGASAKISKAVAGIDNGLARFALKWGGSILSEGFEEAAQEVLNPLFMNLAAGYDTGEKVNWSEVAYSGLLGALSGGFIDGIDMASNAYSENSFNKKMGQNIRTNEAISNVIDMASISPEASAAYEAYTQFANKGVTAENISNKQVGKLYSLEMMEAQEILDSKTATAEEKQAARDKINDLSAYAQSKPTDRMDSKAIKQEQKTDVEDNENSVKMLIESGLASNPETTSYKLATEYNEKIKSGKNLTKNEISKLMEANAEAISTENKTAVTERLTELGESEENISEVADLITRKLGGEILTKEEQQVIKDSKYGSQVLEEEQDRNIDDEVKARTETMSEEDAKLFKRLYDGKMDIDAYTNAFNLISTYAEKGFTQKYIDSQKVGLTPSQINEIYKAKRIQADHNKQAEIKAKNEATANKLAYKGFVDDSIIEYDTPFSAMMNKPSSESRTEAQPKVQKTETKAETKAETKTKVSETTKTEAKTETKKASETKETKSDKSEKKSEKKTDSKPKAYVSGNNGKTDGAIIDEVGKDSIVRTIERDKTDVAKAMTTVAEQTVEMDKPVEIVYVPNPNGKNIYAMYFAQTKDSRGGQIASINSTEGAASFDGIYNMNFVNETGFMAKVNNEGNVDTTKLDKKPFKGNPEALKQLLNNIYENITPSGIRGQITFTMDDIDVNNFNEVSCALFSEVSKYLPESVRQTLGFKSQSFSNMPRYIKFGGINSSVNTGNAINIDTVEKAEGKHIDMIEKLMAMDDAQREFYLKSIQDNFRFSESEGKMNIEPQTKVKWSKLDTRQRKAITFVKGLATATGMNLVFVANADFNGAYHIEGNTIYMDVYAGYVDDMGKLVDTIIPTMSHEVTHWMKDKAPELWRELNEIVFNTLVEHYNSNADAAIKDKIDLLNRLEPGKNHTEESARERNITEEDLINAEVNRLEARDLKDGKVIDYFALADEARDEIIARSCEDMLKMSEQGKKYFNSLSETQKKTLWDKIKDIIQTLKDWVSDLLGSYDSTSREAMILRQYDDKLNQMSKIWDKMLKESVEANQGLEKSGTYKRNNSTENGVREQAKELDSNGNQYWQIETDKDIFKGIMSVKGLQDAAYNYILNGDKGNKIIGLIDGKNLEFIRVSAKEYVYGDASKTLSTEEYKQKMRMSTSIIDLIENASIQYDAPDHKNHKLFPNGFKNYQGRVGIDETIFRYIVRVGKAKNGMIFYDINLEVDGKVPRANRTSLIESSTSNGSIRNSDKNVKTNISDKDNEMRFSMKENVEETKDLIAVHNLSAEKLLKTLKLGGLPMPSIAITRAREGYNNFGAISLIFGKDTINPKSARGNKVYSGDAWTPTFPRVENKINGNVVETIKEKIDKLVPKNIQEDIGNIHLDTTNVEYDLNHNGGIARRYLYDSAMKYAFLRDSGIELELPMKQKPLSRSGRLKDEVIIKIAESSSEEELINVWNNGSKAKPEFEPKIIEALREYLQEKYEDEKIVEALMPKEELSFGDFMDYAEDALKYKRNGIQQQVDYKAASTLIDEKVDIKKYEAWLKDLFSGVVAKEGLRNNKDLYTPSGNRRSFEALHYELTLENVVKAMKEQGTKGIGGFGNGNIFGASTREYKSIDDIKADAENRMHYLPESEYDKLREGFSDRFLEIAQSLKAHDTRSAADLLVEAVSKFKTKSGMANYLRTESKGWANYSDYIVDDLIELVNDIRNMPAQYFEAKPQRAVGFDEIKAVVMPSQESYEDDLSEVKSQLEKLNIPILEYEYGDNNARIKALNSLENVRFSEKNTENNDILFSEKSESIYDIMGERDQALKDIENFKAEIERLNERLKLERTVTGGNQFNQNQLGTVAGHLRNISQSNMDKVELMKSLKEFYTFIATSENLSWEEVYDKSYRIAETMLSEAKPLTITDDYAKSLLREIRNTRISLDETQKKEASYIFDKHWNRNFMGKVIIADNGTPIEVKWQEWHNLYPDIFRDDLSDGDKIRELYDIIESLKASSEMVDKYAIAEQTKWLANEIYNQYWNVSPIRTTADKYDKQIKRLNFAHRQAMNEMRENYNSKLAEKKAQIKKQKDLYKKLRERKDNEIKLAKERGKEKLDIYKDNAQRKTYIQRITANALTLNKWLTTNSKDYHIHDDMKGPVIQLLNAIDFSSKSKLEKGVMTQKDITFNKAFADVKSMLEKADSMTPGFEEFYGHGLAEPIKILSEAAERLVKQNADNNYVINAMTSSELENLDKLVRYIKKVVNDVNKFHTIQFSKGAVALANEFIEYGAKFDKLTKQHGNVAKYLEFRNRTPYYFFKTLGPAGLKLFEAFQDGWDKLAYNAKQIIDYSEEAYTTKEVQEWSKETKTFTLKQDGESRDVEMSIAQIMSLYCVAKQDDAQYHLLHGGMTLKRFDKKGIAITDYDNITLTPSDIQTMIDSLTDRQIEVADALQKFMNTVCSDWGNEISKARFGIEQFGIENYFPIKVSDANVPTDTTRDIDNASLFRLLNMSFTKLRKTDAPQSIEIGDIFDIFAQHSSDMAKYNALALPVLDFNKFYSIKGMDSANKEYGVAKTLQSVFGNEANGYLRRFVRDINGSQNVSRDTIGNSFMKKAKVASVAANMRVVLLQPTAFYKASAVMDYKYLAKASAYIKVNPVTMIGKLKKAIERAEEHCGIVQWKSLGYYDTDISKGLTEKIKHSEGITDKLIEKSMIGAELADKATFGTLWVACEFEVRDKHPELKVGSKEFNDAIAKRLREIIYATQVVDSTMTRSDLMRSPDKLDKMYTAFMSEPTIAYNMLLDMATQKKRDVAIYGEAEAKRRSRTRIKKTVTAYLLTNLVAALVESAVDAFRDDDDEDIVKFLLRYLDNFISDMSIIGKLPYLKEIISAFSGYSSSRMDTQWVTHFVNAGKNIDKLIEGKGSIEKLIKSITQVSSDFTGLPIYNLYRDSAALINNLID